METAAFGRDEANWLSEVGGIAVRDSLVFVYDPPEGRVVVLNEEDLRPRSSFGRRGGGPGEMNPFVSRGMLGPQWQWLAFSRDTLLVFDGLAVHQFTPEGKFVGRTYGDAVKRAELNDGSPTITATRDGLLSSDGGYHLSPLRKGDDRYRWKVLRHGARRPEALLSLQLVPLPDRGTGVGFEGPAQARPVWALSPDCLVASDGGAGWMARVSLDGSGVDTLTFPLPNVVPPRIDRDEIGRLSGMVSKGQGGGYLEPTLERRISAIVVDPDGYAWILPTQDASHAGSGVEIVRLSLATGAAVRDTVPAFPLTFGRPGVFYARAHDPIAGTAEVVRYEAFATSTEQH